MGDGGQVLESLSPSLRRVVTTRAEAVGLEGERWLTTVPGRLERACLRWEVQPDGVPVVGDSALVLPVRSDSGEPGVIRMAWPDPLGRERADHLALRAWSGRGAVRLLAASPADGMSLLERLGVALAVAEPERGSEVLCELAVRLTRPALARVPRVEDEVGRALSGPETAQARARLPRRFVVQAQALARTLPTAAGASERLLATGLDAGHVLARCGQGDGWVSSRPRAAVGDPAYGLAPVLLDPAGGGSAVIHERVEEVSGVTGVSQERLRGWAIVRVVTETVLAVTTPVYLGRTPTPDAATREAVAAAVIRLKTLQPQ